MLVFLWVRGKQETTDCHAYQVTVTTATTTSMLWEEGVFLRAPPPSRACPIEKTLGVNYSYEVHSPNLSETTLGNALTHTHTHNHFYTRFSQCSFLFSSSSVFSCLHRLGWGGSSENVCLRRVIKLLKRKRNLKESLQGLSGGGFCWCRDVCPPQEVIATHHGGCERCCWD